ncbi:hypothetical protein NA66_10012 [Burkholderia pyrrocinia]|uniref:Uncharacterized protein n=1 Tax=Burkholderia pyrrocinia TaxID=60550 RepID=A0A318JJI3_BURPY|nr:hypothetical protein NA66_10012 [Burkholderia pyrrocinia]SFW26373.1 hypothetical protein SAMN03159384_00835 [Burkholderia sp. NFACC33-1]
MWRFCLGHEGGLPVRQLVSELVVSRFYELGAEPPVHRYLR